MLLAQAWVLPSLVPVLMRLPLGTVRAILEPARPLVTCDDRHARRVLAIVNLALQSGVAVQGAVCRANQSFWMKLAINPRATTTNAATARDLMMATRRSTASLAHSRLSAQQAICP
jgi:hypothetical protein